MLDQQVGEHRPPGTGEQGGEVTLDPDGVGGPAEAEPFREAADVGVHDDPLVDPVRVPEDDIRRLPADPRQRDQRLHRTRQLAAVFLEHTS